MGAGHPLSAGVCLDPIPAQPQIFNPQFAIRNPQ
jgi:hypothetical protein